MDDLISRQAALDALTCKFRITGKENAETVAAVIDDFNNRIKALPSAQPVNIAKLQPNCNQVASDCASHCASHCASDCISRQAAIEALDKRFDKIPMEQTTEILKLRKDLRGLPSIQSEQKRGRWIYGEDEYGIDGYHCDKCGFFVPWDYTHKFINYIEDYNFCPSCGADMRGEQDE